MSPASSLIAFCSPLVRLSLTRQPQLTIATHRQFSSVHLPDSEIEKVTRDWFERIVVGWNLCPFADRPNREGKMKIEIVRGAKEEDLLAALLGECIERQDLPGTTLIVAPECYPTSFEDYLSYCTAMEEDFFPQHQLEGDIQIAPFHPLFEFADSTGVDVWTNRSPYPIFHILREEEVTIAVEKLDGDSSKVWQRNIGLLEDMEKELGGAEELERVVRNASHEHTEAIRNMLIKHRFGYDTKEN